MKKTFLITSVLLAFLCFSCDDEPLDADITIEVPVTNPTDPTDPTDPVDPTDPTDPTDPGSTLSTYTFDVNTNAPIFGEIITNTDFNIQNGVVTSQNIELTIFGFTENSLSTYTRDANENIISIQDTSGGTGQNTTTITYTGTNITQIEYDFSADNTDDYIYNFTYSGNTISKTTVGTTDTATFTFDATTSRLISIEYFDNGVSTVTETLSYDTSGNCTQAVVSSGGTNTTITYNFDNNTNPLKTVFQDVYLLSILNGDHEDEISATIANFHGVNNWIGGESTEGTFNFNPIYDAENKILSKGGVYNLGEGVTVTQSEVYQY